MIVHRNCAAALRGHAGVVGFRFGASSIEV
jgi:hypothetical protein